MVKNKEIKVIFEEGEIGYIKERYGHHHETKPAEKDSSDYLPGFNQFANINIALEKIEESLKSAMVRSARRFNVKSDITIRVFDESLNLMHKGCAPQSTNSEAIFLLPTGDILHPFYVENCNLEREYNKELDGLIREYIDRKESSIDYGLKKPFDSRKSLEDTLLRLSRDIRREGFILFEPLEAENHKWNFYLEESFKESTENLSKRLTLGSWSGSWLDYPRGLGDGFYVNANLIPRIIALHRLGVTKGKSYLAMPEKKYIKILNEIRNMDLLEFYQAYFSSFKSLDLNPEYTILPKRETLKALSDNFHK